MKYEYTENIDIELKLDSTSGYNIFNLFDNQPTNYEKFYRDSGYHVAVTRYLFDLTAMVTIRSIPPAPLPNLDPLASKEEVARAYHFYEWGSRRKQLNLLSRKNSTASWKLRAAISLVNREDLPHYQLELDHYLTRSEQAVRMGEQSELAIAIHDTGAVDAPLSGQDEVNVFGTITKEIKVVRLLADMEKVGEIMTIAYSQADPGWLLCDGRALDRNQYSLLFAKIGTQFGAGDGVKTFNLPNLSNSQAVGAGTRVLGNAIAAFTVAPAAGTGTIPRSLAVNYQIFTGVYV